jgi:hypothetical protein
MASQAVGLAGAGGAFAAAPGLGWALSIGAAVFDAYVLQPHLVGKGRGKALTPRLLDAPIGSNEAGAPRISAYGQRVRVPTHVLWQAEKVREINAGGQKGGQQAGTLRRVSFDALIGVNDRLTVRASQFSGNGKLLLTASRNLVEIKSAAMSVAIVSGRVVLTMGDTEDPDFSHKFKVGDVVDLSGFIITSGLDINVGFWKVQAVTEHTSAPSSISLDRYSGQNIVATVASSGTLFSPASITRVDDRVFNEGGGYLPDPAPGTTINFLIIPVDSHLEPALVFEPDSRVVTNGLSLPGFGPLDSLVFYVDLVRSTPAQIVLVRTSGQFTNATAAPIFLTGASSSDAATISFQTYPRFTAGIFDPTFDPDAHFHNGAEDQDEDELLAAAKGTGNVPAYRGVACQAFDNFYATQFGDSLPYSLEAVIDVDPFMSWPDALATILHERSAFPYTAIDTSGVTAKPFLGCYLRGPVPAATSLQPLLMAGQIAGQERDGTLALFDIDNADVVEIKNDVEETHFGCRLDGGEVGDDKWIIEDAAVEDLPTSIGVRHQDPDNGYADGYQFFGLRHPEGVDHQNAQEIDLSNVVLTRKDAASLASTVMQRAWVNARTFRFVLPDTYLDLLENDILTWVDDEGETQTARVIQRDIGNDFRVHVVALREVLDQPQSIGGVDGATEDTPQTTTGPAAVEMVIVDAPAVRDQDAKVPALVIAVGSRGGNWVGATLYESQDGGSSWAQVDATAEQNAIGTLAEELPETDAAESYGTTEVTVDGSSYESEFTPFGVGIVDDTTEDEAGSGTNWCAIVDPDGTTEIAAFTTATDMGDGVLALGGWLRGLRGTAPSSHAAGARIVMLTGPGSSVIRREFAGAVSPTDLAYKIVPAGLSVDDVEPVYVTAQWHNARPLPVRSISKTIGGSPYDARIKVEANWCRQVLPVGAQPPHSMDEPIEGYRFTIYDPTGTDALRTFDLTVDPDTGSPTLRDKWFDYDASSQSDDGYTPSGTETFWVDVQQIGEFGLGPSIKQEI